MNELHFTVGGIAAFAAFVLGILRLIAAVKPWFEWRRKTELVQRILVLHAPEEARKQIEELLK